MKAILHALRSEYGNSLLPGDWISPINVELDAESTTLMNQALERTPKSTLPGQSGDPAWLGPTKKWRERRLRARNAFRSSDLRRKLETFNRNPKYQELRMKKEDLPMIHYRNEVIDMIEENIYSVILGATGSGKTTQVPQILFEHAIMNDLGAECNIICTQPRRISAISIACRVADERGEQLQETIGYQVRMHSRLPRLAGSITYCTIGCLLVRLRDDADGIFENYSHLIIDEVHERVISLDFLLVVLKRAIEHRLVKGKRFPKVVLMSATIDAEFFARYFRKNLPDETIHCPSLKVPGRLFPVTEKHLGHIWRSLQREYPRQLGFVVSDSATNEYICHESQIPDAQSSVSKSDHLEETWRTGEDETYSLSQKAMLAPENPDLSVDERLDRFVPIRLAAAVVAHLAKTTDEGAILTFLPGLDEILKLERLLRMDMPFAVNFQDASKFKILVLHSSISNDSQAEVFDSVPQGCRKIILATNIAETSVTIPDVRYVVDTGKMREKRFNQSQGLSKLECTWISQSNSKQRAGRAGRVQNGFYYALFSQGRLAMMRATGLPEMLRSDLQNVCLDVKTQSANTSIAKFLAGAIEPPPPQAVAHAIENLQTLEALTDVEELTPLGRLLISLPVDPASGKMIVLGVIFRCLDAMLILAACRNRSIFVSPPGQKRKVLGVRRAFSQNSGSDHIAFLNAYRMMRNTAIEEGNEAARRIAESLFIDHSYFRSMEATAYEIERVLVEAGLIPYTPRTNRYNNEVGDPSLNENSSNFGVIKALLTAGLANNLAVSISRSRLETELSDLPTMIHPTCVSYVKHGKGSTSKSTGDDLYVYNSMVKSSCNSALFLRDISPISPLTAALFGGRLRQKPTFGPTETKLVLNQWLPISVPENLLQYREALDMLLSSTFQSLLSNRGRGQGNEKHDEKNVEYGKVYLADEPSRAFFVDGVIHLLIKDAAKRKEVEDGGGAETISRKAEQEIEDGGGAETISRKAEQEEPQLPKETCSLPQQKETLCNNQ